MAQHNLVYISSTNCDLDKQIYVIILESLLTTFEERDRYYQKLARALNQTIITKFN